MPPTLFNQSADIVENYKGHVEILDENDSLMYKYDEMLDWSVSTIADTEKHYSTDGKKKKTIIGNSSVYEIRIKRTADQYDPLTLPLQTKTISYWKSLIYGIPPTLPNITLQGVSQSNAATNQFIVDKFTATVENIDENRDESKGTEEVVISGEILTHDNNKRQASAP